MGFIKRNYLLVTFWIAVASMLAWRLLPSLLGIQVFSGYDMLDRFAPWSALETAGDTHTGNPFITDLLDSQGPALIEIRERLAAGDWPLQTNLVQGGTTLLATPSLGFFIPPRLAWLVLPLAIAPAWVKLIELLFMVGFTFLFARRLGFNRFAASISGFVAAFSGFALAWNGWPQSSVIAMAPMLFWAVERFVQLRRWRDLVPVSLASFFLLIGGFPAVAGHTFVFAGLYALIRYLFQNGDERPLNAWQRIGDLARLALGVVVGALLSMFQLLPFVELTIGGASLDYRNNWSALQDGPNTWLTTILPRSVVTGAAFQDQAAYVGSVALVLIALGLLGAIRGGLPRGTALLFVGVSLFVVAFISFQSVFNWGEYVRNLPLLANNPPGRLRAQLAVPAAMLAGLGVQWVMAAAPRGEWRGPGRLKPGFSWTSAVTSVIAVLALGALLMRYVPFARARGIAEVESDLQMALIPMVVTVGIIVLAVFVKQLRNAGLALIGVAVVVQSVLVTAFYWPTSDPDEVYPENETMAYLADHVQHDQLATAGLVLRPNVPNIYGVRLVNGHAFATQAWQEALQKADPFTFSMGGTYSIFRPDRSAIFENPTLDAMGVRYVAASADEYLGAAGVPVPLPGQQVAIVADGPELTQLLDASGLRSEFEGNWAGVNGVTVPMELNGEVTVEARALDASGNPIAENLVQFASPGTNIQLPVALAIPEDARVAKFEVAITPEVVDGVLARVSVPTSEGQITAQAVLNTPETEAYPVVYAGENVIVWERETALNRIRMSPSATGAGQLSANQANIEVYEDTGDVIRVRAKTQEPAYLTVVQALGKHYRATVDGVPVDIHPADDGAYVIPIPAGEHEISIEFAPRSVRFGVIMSAVGVVALITFAASGPIVDWHRRKTNTQAS